MLELQFSSQAKEFLNKLDQKNWNRIIGKIEELRENPFPRDVKRVKGQKDKIFRVRVGDYRIQYSVFYDRNLIFISDIDRRERAYD